MLIRTWQCPFRSHERRLASQQHSLRQGSGKDNWPWLGSLSKRRAKHRWFAIHRLVLECPIEASQQAETPTSLRAL